MLRINTMALQCWHRMAGEWRSLSFRRGPAGDRAMKSKRTGEAIAAELDVPQRILLFCLASNTNVAKI
jgi:hypothetical protein